MSNPDVSIVVINYKSFEMVRDCVASIERFTKKYSYEIIIIDNESTDDRIELLQKKFNQIIVVRNTENTGFSAANNQGFKLARGRYILILNNDTLFTEDSLAVLIDYYEQRGKNMLLGCTLLNSDGSLQYSAAAFDTIVNTLGEAFFLDKIFKSSRFLNRNYVHHSQVTQATEVGVVKGACIFTTADIIKKMQGFDEHFFFFGEETDLCHRAKAAGYEVVYLPTTNIIHLGGATVTSMSWFNHMNLTISRIRLYKKNYSTVYGNALLLIYYSGLLLRIPLYLLIAMLKRNSEYLKKTGTYLRMVVQYPEWVSRISAELSTDKNAD